MNANLAVVTAPADERPSPDRTEVIPPPVKPTLAAALALADHVSPSPAEARAALLVLRQALADTLAVSIETLQLEAAGTPAGRI